MNEALLSLVNHNTPIVFPMLGDLEICPPSSLSLFGREVYFYGLIIALGFIIALYYCGKIGKDFGISEEDLLDLFIWLVPCSLAGSRLYYVVFNPSAYISDPSRIFAVWEGGLAIYGGIIAGALVIFFVCRRKKLSALAMLDVCVYGLLIGQIMGRWGNFFNREAFGAVTDVFCRMGFVTAQGTVYVHPTFLYESLWNLSLLIFLIVFKNKGLRRYDGQCGLIYFFGYGLGRVWIEGLRTDSLYIGSSGIRVSQALSAALILVTLIILIIQSRREHSADKLFVNQLAARAVVSVEAPKAEQADGESGSEGQEE